MSELNALAAKVNEMSMTNAGGARQLEELLLQLIRRTDELIERMKLAEDRGDNFANIFMGGAAPHDAW